ncbi:MAG: RHS repeat-associated core domain-containing protein, partial [bacterium]
MLAYDARGKVVEANIASGRPSLSEHRRMAYSGLGALIATSRARGGGVWTDEYMVDGFANVLEHESNRADVQQHRRYTSDVVDGQRLANTLVVAPDSALNGAPPPVPLRHLDQTLYEYDAAGNQTKGAVLARRWTTNGSYEATLEGSSWTRSYYDADDRLRVFQETGYPSATTGFPRRTTFAEYRYDPLGRRVLVRTQRDTACVQTYCGTAFEKLSVIDRFVWDGDQLVYEYRSSADYATHGIALESEPGVSAFTGSVHYFHAGGIDQPLALWRDGNAGYIPFLSWRGGFEAVTRADGSDPSIYMAALDREPYMAADSRQGPQEENYWLGSLVMGKADLSGLMYMRNRYYDPKAGRFTQEDPIGLAGGVNLYGFGSGDPVNFTDPFGLCPDGDRLCEIARIVAARTAPVKRPIEIAAMVVTAPLSGGMGMMGEATELAVAGRAFWSGGKLAKNAAAAWAGARRGQTLEMTAAGRALEGAGDFLANREAWMEASRQFAEGANG